jgi:selenide,water dikinase
LAQVLRHVPAIDDPRVLVDAATRDDAAVFQVAPDRALVATVDFFTPIVDDAHAFGRVAATNALSDLYAMGARPLFGLNLVAWPRSAEMLALLGQTLRGGADVAREAGLLILGGHSIDDAEPKYGLVAVGEVHPARVLKNRGARPGDRLVLTKPIGTGILATALKQDLLDERGMEEAIGWMTTLNVGAMEAALALGPAVHACTDVSGFGLLGHLRNMLEGGGVAARVRADAVPLLGGARDLASRGAVPGGTVRNREAATAWTTWPAGMPEAIQTLLCDAQTSGGLLLAVSAAEEAALRRELARRGVTGWTVGEIVAGAGTVEVA